MEKTWQIIFSGVGGQGLMLAGKLLGAAATGYEGKNAVMTSVYGVETRGTFAKSDVIVSGEEIDYPEVLKADVVIALAPVAYRKYADSLGEGAILLYDDAIEPMETKAVQIGFPIAKIAKEAGNSSMVNVVALGALVKLTGIVSEQAVQSAVREEFQGKARLMELNLKALHGGLKAAAGIAF
ncbi:MAG: 2-oxoacid:acceptor oxidoreductase family protein [Clostridiales bacterium]|nr:2-oxoacid:acceptor oxidoreductase family protein [Clostridiales bacterium]